MTASAIPAPAPQLVRVRPHAAVRAGTYAYDATDVTSAWHVHDLHQIEYAIEGFAQVETATARYLLPPQRAAWIPAGLAHKTTLKSVRTVAVFLDPAMITGKSERARILSVRPVLREMIAYGARWPVSRSASDEVADSFFDTLAILVARWLDDDEVALHLPASADPIVAAAMRYTDEHLGSATLPAVCAAVAVSERTLRRRFAHAGISWRQYQLRSRLLHAMALLAEPDNTVLSVATRVGFDSGTAFSRAFTRHVGAAPSSYRQRAPRRR